MCEVMRHDKIKNKDMLCEHNGVEGTKIPEIPYDALIYEALNLRDSSEHTKYSTVHKRSTSHGALNIHEAVRTTR